MHRYLRIGAAIAALAMAVLPASALGSARANGKQSSKISSAVHNSSMTKSTPDREYKVVDIRVSTKPKGWAKATIKGKPGFTNKVQPATAVLHFKGGHWRVVEVGGAGLGCNVPASVDNELKLGGCGY